MTRRCQKSCDTPSQETNQTNAQGQDARMSALKGRAKRNLVSSGQVTGTLNCAVRADLKAMVERTAAATGRSKAGALELILANVPLDEHGVAVWAAPYLVTPDEPLALDVGQQLLSA